MDRSHTTKAAYVFVAPQRSNCVGPSLACRWIEKLERFNAGHDLFTEDCLSSEARRNHRPQWRAAQSFLSKSVE